MNTVFKRIRPPAWAGRFYPGDPEALRHDIKTYLAEARGESGPSPKAIIAPHAGYAYSGPIAGSAFSRLVPDAAAIRRIILLGPSHHVAFAGLALSSAEAFATPLGPIPLDHTLDDKLTSLPCVQVFDEAHANEHSLEVQLPFLRHILGDFSLLPLVVGDATEDEVASVLEQVWGGMETRIVISSDLSHYLEYETAQNMDQATARAIEGLRSGEIKGNQACGRLPIRGLLHAARAHALQGGTIDLRNSGDTAGSRDRVVGYGAFVFTGTMVARSSQPLG